MGEGEITICKLMEELGIQKKKTGSYKPGSWLEEVPGTAWLNEDGKLKKTLRAPLVHDLTLYLKYLMSFFRWSTTECKECQIQNLLISFSFDVSKRMFF